MTLALEVAHHGEDGVLHGHSLTIELWTERQTCLDAWRAEVRGRIAHIEGQLEATIGGRTFEEVAAAILDAVPEAVRVTVRLPSRGHAIEATR